jgi:hypothetical protein
MIKQVRNRELIQTNIVYVKCRNPGANPTTAAAVAQPARETQRAWDCHAKKVSHAISATNHLS